MAKEYSYFSHRDCEYFPCHEGADPDSFNCLFCYCPLYMLGDKCGGDFFFDEKGTKVCTGCMYPHRRESYEDIRARFDEIKAAISSTPEEKSNQ